MLNNSKGSGKTNADINRKSEFDSDESKTYEVRSKLGERFFSWQTDGTLEESWEECKLHAKNILGEKRYHIFIENLVNDNISEDYPFYFSITKEDREKNQKSIYAWSDKK